MKTLRMLLPGVLALVLLAGVLNADEDNDRPKPKPNHYICISFDELPIASTFGEVDQNAINYLILEALKKHEAKAVGFVVGDRIGDSWDVLGQWLNEGHRLGNMTMTGQDLNQVQVEQFIKEIESGAATLEPMLSGFGQKKRYFRYPFLHYGETVQTREAIGRFLEDRDIVVCHATVVPEDYLYDLNLQKMGKEPDSVQFLQLGQDYIRHVLDQLHAQENLAREMTDGRINHILELRANRLNAVYLDPLLGALEEEGYRFVGIDEALKDKIFRRPEAYYGMKGLGYLEMIKQSNPDLLPAQ